MKAEGRRLLEVVVFISKLTYLKLFLSSLSVRSKCFPLTNPFWHENANLTASHKQLLRE